MNKILKVVFNHVKGCFVAVSELSKSHSKTSKCRKLLLTIPLFFIATSSWADAPIADLSLKASGWTTLNDLSGGSSSSMFNLHQSSTDVLEVRRLILEDSWRTTVGTVIGTGSTDTGAGTVSFGIGSGSDSDWKFLADLDGTQRYLGDQMSSGDDSVSGHFYDVHRDEKTGLLSIYKYSFRGQKTSESPTVSNGYVYDASTRVELFNSLDLTYVSSGSVVTSGNTTFLNIDTSSTRRLTNVSDGIDDTDAATVGQLKSVSSSINSINEYISINDTSSTRDEADVLTSAKALGGNSIAIGETARATGSKSFAVGYFAQAKNLGSVAMGWNSIAGATNSIAIGTNATAYGSGSSVALGYESDVTYEDGNWTDEPFGVVSVGQSKDLLLAGEVVVPAFTRRIINVSSGLNDSDVSTVGQVTQGLSAILGEGVTVGVDADGKFTVALDGTAGIANTGKTTVSEAIASLTSNSSSVDWANLSSDAQDAIKSNISLSKSGASALTVTQDPTDKGKWTIGLSVDDVLTENSSNLISSGAVYSALNKVSSDLSSDLDMVTENLEGRIETNKSDIAANKTDIATNKSGIASNKTAIEANASAITGVAKATSADIDVAAWTAKLGVDDLNTDLTAYMGKVDQNISDIATNKSDIATNKSSISANTTEIDKLILGSNINVSAWSSVLGVGEVQSGNAGLVTGGAVYDAIQNISSIASSGAAVDASNVGKNAATDNSDKWGEALGTGVVEAGNGKLVTGDVVNTAINTAVSNKLDNDLSSLSDTGKSTISNIAKETAQSAVTVGNGKHTEVTVQTDASGNMTYQVNVKTDGQVTQGNEGIVTGGTVYDAIQSVKNETNANLDKKLDKETFENYQKSNDEKVAVATNTANQALDTATEAKTTADSAKSTADAAMSTADEAKTIAGEANTNAQTALAEAAKHTTVTSSNNSLTVKETTNAQGGKNYDLSVSLGKDQAFETVSAGQGKNQIVMNGNDGTLKVGETVTIHGSTGAITGVAAGEISATSKDAVNGAQLYETQQMIGQNASNIQTLNQQINKTYDKVQRVGAGAAALAALRPQDFSPDHPISGAVGLGHYDGKQAIAVGMYYRPTENFTVGFGASAAGNDDYMMNAGISYRFGGSGSQLRLSQSDINRKVVDLTDQNRALIAQIESSNIREEASANRLNKVTKQLASTQSALKSTQSELKTAQKKAEVADQKLDMVMKELAALREEIQKMKQK